MINYLHYIDWRIVLLAWLACYFLPSLVMGEVLASLTDESLFPSHVGRPVASFFAFFYLFLPPLLAGSLAARFARSLPLLSTAILTVLGWALISPSFVDTSMQALATYAAISMALAMLGARTQRVRKQNY